MSVRVGTSQFSYNIISVRVGTSRSTSSLRVGLSRCNNNNNFNSRRVGTSRSIVINFFPLAFCSFGSNTVPNHASNLKVTRQI